MKPLACVLLILVAALAARAEKPNIVIILADDLGFSDIAPYGSEIETPNLQQLADEGLSFTRFHNAGRCCPTRASLLTGLHPHQAGIGHMTGSEHDRGVIGYRGNFNDEVVTIAEVLRGAGYRTIMTGKWHVGIADREDWPLQRGFDRYYGILDGASNYFEPQDRSRLQLGNEPVAPESTTDRRYYTTDAFADHACRFVRDSVEEDPDRPFFLYLSFTAPHWPLHAHEEEVAKYRGKYRQGWDPVRKARYERIRKLGLLGDEAPLSPRDAEVPDWESLSEEKRDALDHRMAVFAAMVDRMDQKIGDLLRTLDETGTADDTLVVFLSDNGACQEGGALGGGPDDATNTLEAGWFQTLGLAWANVGSTPFREYKHFVHEGGSVTPFIVRWPQGIAAKGEIRRQFGYLPDLMATAVELAGATYPEQSGGKITPPMEGTSLLPAFADRQPEREWPVFLEHEGNRAVFDRDWKLVSKGDEATYGGDESWELYNLGTDRGELVDLREKHPERVRKMSRQWRAWAESHRVLPNGLALNPATRFELKKGERLARTAAPNVAGRAFTLEAAFEAGHDGIVVAQGGSAHGYALYVRAGRLGFATRHDGRLRRLVTADELPGSGRIEVSAVLGRDGRTELRLGDRVIGSGKLPGPLKDMPVDGLEVGRDEGGRVLEEGAGKPFAGRIHSVEIQLD